MINLQILSLADRKEQASLPKSVVCLGNFDGVHLGHRALLQRAREWRAQDFPDAALCVFCFVRPSSDYLSPAPHSHLCSLEQKLERFAKEGMEYAVLANFEDIRDFSPAQFVDEVLHLGCHCSAAVCGFNYRFGKGGFGTSDLLSSLLQAPVSVVPEVRELGDTVSSTRIRRLLWEGDVQSAAVLLGTPYTLSADVVHGKALGHQMGIPTINQHFPPDTLIPRHGVYITECTIADQCYRGISNVGVHPTVDQDAPVNCETHLLDWSGDLYGQNITVSFLKFLRSEKKFSSIEELTAQIKIDSEVAKRFPEE